METAKIKTILRRKSKAGSVVSQDRRFSISSQDSMLNRRKRSLTLPLENPAVVKNWRGNRTQQTFEQLQSKLFAIPIEVRLIIWELVLGGHNVHVFDWGKKMGHVTCKASSNPPIPTRQTCFGLLGESSMNIAHGIPENLLSLLKSCRRM